MIEETNAVFDEDDADATSEGSVSNDNNVYPPHIHTYTLSTMITTSLDIYNS